jgi:hypothetical protein
MDFLFRKISWKTSTTSNLRCHLGVVASITGSKNNFFPISKAKTAGHFGRYQSRGFKADEPISQADVSDWQLDSRLSSIA